MFVFIILGENY